MSSDFSYDPVTAVDEAQASGETAKLFADIRTTMGIPLVTSIWRGLAGMDDALPTVWALARPIYASGAAQGALARVVEETALPVPQALAPTQLACVGVDDDALSAIRAIIAAYNRSNGMNLVALAALIAPHAGDEQAPVDEAPSPPNWPALAVLPAQGDIHADTWTLIRHLNAFGSPGLEANVATLWRHLAHWPGLLALIHAGLAPHQASGAIDAATGQMVTLAQREGRRMAHLRGEPVVMSTQAHETITGYVTTPTQVVRMVTLGHALARWLA